MDNNRAPPIASTAEQQQHPAGQTTIPPLISKTSSRDDVEPVGALGNLTGQQLAASTSHSTPPPPDSGSSNQTTTTTTASSHLVQGQSGLLPNDGRNLVTGSEHRAHPPGIQNADDNRSSSSPPSLHHHNNNHNSPQVHNSTMTTTTAAGGSAAAGSSQWLAAAANQTRQDIGQRVSQASDQINNSLRQLYVSASSIAAAEAVAQLPPSYHNIPGVVPYYHGRSIGPPPSYDDVINPYAPPPTYQSLFGQMRQARKTSRGLLDLLRRLLIILISTLGCTLLLAFMILIPFTMIIIGAIYIDECRIEHIPAFLLVGGLVWASKNIIHCYSQCKQQEQQAQQLADGADVLAALNLYQPPVAAAATLAPSSSSSSSLPNDDTEDTSSLSSSSAALNGQQRTRLAAAVAALDAHDEEVDQQHQQQATITVDGNGRIVQLVAGGGPISSSSTTNIRRLQQQQRQQQQQQHIYQFRLKSSICDSLLNCVLFSWFIAGCIIIFRNYDVDFEHSDSSRYCHRTVYMYTFWLISSVLMLFGLFIGCICCLMVSSAVSNHRPQHDGIDEMA